MYTAILKQHGHQALMSASTYEATDLVKIAQEKICDAIVVSNTKSLHKITNRPPVGTYKGATLDEYRGSRFNYAVPIYIINPLEHLVTVNHGRWLFGTGILKRLKRVSSLLRLLSGIWRITLTRSLKR